MSATAYMLQWSDDRCGNALVRVADGCEIGMDWGEPEDKTFTRDFGPVVDELNAVTAHRDDLLAALREMLALAGPGHGEHPPAECCYCREGGGDAQSRARAAIAKAEGRP